MTRVVFIRSTSRKARIMALNMLGPLAAWGATVSTTVILSPLVWPWDIALGWLVYGIWSALVIDQWLKHTAALGKWLDTDPPTLRWRDVRWLAEQQPTTSMDQLSTAWLLLPLMCPYYIAKAIVNPKWRRHN